MITETTRTGGCLCGAVRFAVRSEPYKSGPCHRTDCRHVTGSAFLAYADWRPDQFEASGKVSTPIEAELASTGSVVFLRQHRLQ